MSKSGSAAGLGGRSAPYRGTPGETPSRVSWDKRCVLVEPSQLSDAQEKSLAAIRAKLRSVEADLATLKTVQTRGQGGFRFELVTASDVEQLYRLAHQAVLLVITVGSAKVHLRIDELPTNSTTMPLSSYLGHKARTIHVSRPEEATRLLAVLDQPSLGLACEGHKDPRCIPFFMFPRTEALDLSDESSRAEFSKRYSTKRLNGSGAYVDGRGREWGTEEFHSADLIHVAGTTLPVGFHWNVQAPKKTELANGWEIWKVAAHGYANVHPDAHIRQGSGATRVAGGRGRRPLRTPREKRSR